MQQLGRARFASGVPDTVIFDTLPGRRVSYCEGCERIARKANPDVNIVTLTMPTREELRQRLRDEYSDDTPPEAAYKLDAP